MSPLDNTHESTVRNWIIKYDEKVRCAGSDEEIVEIPDEKKGRPTKVPVAEDSLVQKHIKNLSETGNHVSRETVIAYGKVILDKRRPELSRRIKLGQSWAESLLKRMKFVQRKVTKAARRSPVNLAETTNTFHKQIRKLVRRGTIPKRLIINIDQTGVLMVPSQNFTLAPRGAKQVTSKGKDDKRAITALLGTTLKGRLLPCQLIYAGKTNK